MLGDKLSCSLFFDSATGKVKMQVEPNGQGVLFDLLRYQLGQGTGKLVALVTESAIEFEVEQREVMPMEGL